MQPIDSPKHPLEVGRGRLASATPATAPEIGGRPQSSSNRPLPALKPIAARILLCKFCNQGGLG